MHFQDAMHAITRGYRAKRAAWETWVFGPWDPAIRGAYDNEQPPPGEHNKMWFDLPEHLEPGRLGSDYEDDSYMPSEIDRAADDWETDAPPMPERPPIRWIRQKDIEHARIWLNSAADFFQRDKRDVGARNCRKAMKIIDALWEARSGDLNSR